MSLFHLCANMTKKFQRKLRNSMSPILPGAVLDKAHSSRTEKLVKALHQLPVPQDVLE